MDRERESTCAGTNRASRFPLPIHPLDGDPGGIPRSRRKLLIEPGSNASVQSALLHLSGLPRAMNATINRMFSGR